MGTKIQWTQETWNPVRGCTRISPGCVNCYAERMAARDLPGHRSPTTGEPFAIRTPSGPRWTGKVELIPSMLDVPLRRRKPTTYFVNSMSDLFHEGLSDDAIDQVFAAMALCPQHTFQCLTKRADRMLRYMSRAFSIYPDSPAGFWRNASFSLPGGPCEYQFPLPNVWLGVSVEDRQRADERIPLLLQTPAAVRFLSVEPLLGPVNLAPWISRRLGQCGCCDAPRPDWVIVGGESGPSARPCNTEWIRSIVQQCKAAGVACFVKQLGAHVIQGGEHRKKADKKGGDMDEWEHDIRVRDYPAWMGRTA